VRSLAILNVLFGLITSSVALKFMNIYVNGKFPFIIHQKNQNAPKQLKMYYHIKCCNAYIHTFTDTFHKCFCLGSIHKYFCFY